MTIRSCCIVADDLSGAADCAASFARVTGPVPVFLGTTAEKAACLAIDTDSRAMEPAAAVATTSAAFEQIGRNGAAYELVYKKIDSTLRGHVGAELVAAMGAAPQFAGVVVAPSFPEQGRSLIGGKLFVQARPADNLGHSGDLMAMLAAARLRPALLGRPQQDCPQLIRGIDDALAAGARAVVVDASEQDDLARLAEALRSPRSRPLLVAGSAGLARALAAHVEPGPMSATHVRARRFLTGPVITVVGSFSKAAAAQVQQVDSSGDAQVIRLDAGQWLADRHAFLRQTALGGARESLRVGSNVLFAIGGEVAQGMPRALVRAMARLTAPLLQHAAACVLTGGDTARAMFDELGIQRVVVSGEFEPGIAMARVVRDATPGFVLKAGGFGDALALQRIIRRFGHPRHRPLRRQPAPC